MSVLNHIKSRPLWCPQEYVQRPGKENGGTCIVMLSCSPLIVGQELPKQMKVTMYVSSSVNLFHEEDFIALQLMLEFLLEQIHGLKALRIHHFLISKNCCTLE